MPHVIVATDGSALKNPNGPGGWAWVVDDRRWNAGSVPQASNQVMEMYAIFRALREIPLHYDITIQTDSAFCVNMVGPAGVSGWMQAWKRRGWKKADGKEPANLKLVLALDEAISARTGKMSFQWVKGHATHKLNNVADKLCTDASASQARNIKYKGGPGWVESKTPPRAPVAPLAVVGRRPVMAPTTGRKLPAARPRPQKEFVITSFDDSRGSVIAKKPAVAVAYCESCGGPINPATSECRCSD